MDSNDVSWWQAVLIIGVIFIGGFFFIKFLVENAPTYDTTYSAPVVEEKPQTKTRCDFTGFMASSIIDEESKNGYRFDGRVNTFLCGENGLSFHLEDQS